MQKWGKNRSVSQRYRCSSCGYCDTRNRTDISHIHHRKLYEDWLVGKQTLNEIAGKNRVDRKTIDRWFFPFRTAEITAELVSVSDAVVIIDGYNAEHGATVLIAQLPTNQTVGWLFTYAENYDTWLELFNSIRDTPFLVVCDGQKGMVKALRARWPRILIQRCQFHVIHQVNLLLTKHPELPAAQQFKQLVERITFIKSRDDLKLWLSDYKLWHQLFGNFLKERTYQETFSPTGRRRWNYTHGRLHAAHSHLKNALPNLFRYIQYPGIPNTSNRIEGSINAQIQRHIDHHRGTTLFQRRQIIAALLKQKQCGKLPKLPTRNVT